MEGERATASVSDAAGNRVGEKILLGTPLKCPDHTATRRSVLCSKSTAKGLTSSAGTAPGGLVSAALNAVVRITEAKDVEEAFAGFNPILPREVSNIWTMEKEGKVRFSPVKYRTEEWWKSVMRK